MLIYELDSTFKNFAFYLISIHSTRFYHISISIRIYILIN